MQKIETSLTLRLWIVNEYYRMVETEILDMMKE